MVSTVAKKIESLVGKLQRQGPHDVLVGDLSYVGVPGKVYVPASGNGVPGIAFGHDWMTDIKNYHATFRHLASWGIAVAAPNTHVGFNPNHRFFVDDIVTALDVLSGVKMGMGNVTVHPKKLVVAGHGMGAGCAVHAATRATDLSAVAGIFPSEVAPSAISQASDIDVPGMFVGPAIDSDFRAVTARRLTAFWGGDAIYREIDKSRASSFSEDIVRKLALGLGKPQFGVRDLTRALLTGFVLAVAEEDSTYSDFADPVEIKKTQVWEKAELFDELPENTDFAEIINRNT